MKKIFKYNILFLILAMGFGCSEYLDPSLDGSLTEEQVFGNDAYFNGVLNTVYGSLPDVYDYMLDCATDNAVTNDYSSDFFKMGTGALRPNMNPESNWVNAYRQIRRINQFLDKMVLDTTGTKPFLTPVRFVRLGTEADSIDNINTFYRMLGEAYFLRAYYEADLLRRYGGKATSGEFLGVPIVTDVLYIEDNLNLPRNTYQECVDQISSDCDSAIKYLPVEYKGTNAVLGATMNGRANGIAAMALKARVLLYGASPAFNPDNDITKWEKAAIAAGDALTAIGGLKDLPTIDNYYFNQLNNKAYNIRDIFLRGNVQSGNRELENNNYPPSMYGSGRVNPSQNFVDAFPDKAGYPISESALYANSDPYTNRDPRLNLFVAVNETTMGPSNYHTIETFEGGVDAFNPSINTSRSGYYLKKLLKYGSVRLIPGQLTGTARAAIHLGSPELYLNFAEAAFEAWGPTGDPMAYGFNAVSVITRIHKRDGSGNDYMNTVAVNDENLFRELIHNERRLELSFEGHYFWDIRRWESTEDLTGINTVVNGVKITKDANGNNSYDMDVQLEKRLFNSIYMPLPYDELFNAPLLVQNKGWE
ncbi:RagB/SusD family nutrient uptake outer membrane protein [Gaoshiqia sediminis]|uniref:RagB/SusD family nutrient uptake outer membrane protein n=1 Tax=Gaoshiqia sediminis TaxID=2986998 RepID=A0AA41YCU4_9BACT|nr:RagB/SusD family nutrient uptake outer membrane protein [Gaoshiqia sediminis]MCW0484253.1 RagB/SusD family nutrient uptake outer membrane protein [Gaoshiqia sediminis]